MWTTFLLLGLAMQNNAIVENNYNVLSIYPPNPHYFQNSNGQPIVLVGDYVETTFSDVDYDFKTRFDTIKANDINFCRVWIFWGCEILCETLIESENRTMVIPYLRTGPGNANDGKPMYDLNQFNPDFFKQLRDVCVAARKRGIFLQLTLFDAWLLKHSYLWIHHAYQRDNNINGVDGDPGNTETGIDEQKGFCSLENTKVLEYQKAFIREVVDTVNGFDNIFYEIANENYYNANWEINLCQFIHEYEKDKPKQHLVMPLDLINHDYGGIKTWDIQELHTNLLKAQSLEHPLIFDTDGIRCPDNATERKGLWTAFVSGGNIDFKTDSIGSGYAAMKQQLKYLATFIKHTKFWEMQPKDSLVKAGEAFTIASKDEIVAYLPNGGAIALDLTNIKGVFSAQWFNTRNGVFGEEFQVNSGELTELKAPDSNDWALLLVRR